jgi:hypothetical protein
MTSPELGNDLVATLKRDRLFDEIAPAGHELELLRIPGRKPPILRPRAHAHASPLLPATRSSAGWAWYSRPGQAGGWSNGPVTRKKFRRLSAFVQWPQCAVHQYHNSHRARSSMADVCGVPRTLPPVHRDRHHQALSPSRTRRDRTAQHAP